MTVRTEKIYVLFGSQTGNSEQAAQDFCAQADERLSPEAIQRLTGTKDEITVETVCMQLDDFLELDRCAWARLTVIVTSSYGVGQAPLGGYRFRELCDAWYETYSSTNDENKDDKNHKKDTTIILPSASILKGFSFCLCGLGDSKYTTFFRNPTRINEALQLVGATRAGPLGKCDASGTGDDEQQASIKRWMDGIWPHVAKVVAQPPLTEEQLASAQQATVDLCRQINPDFLPAPKKQYNLIAVLLVLVAVIAAFYLQSK